VNTVLVQNLNPEVNYSSCMEKLRAAGIYILAGLNAPHQSIWERRRWDRELQARFRGLIESLKVYPNLLGFFITGSRETLPFVRAAIRDLKPHLWHGSRKLPIGYFSVNHNMDSSQNLNCGHEASSIDFLILGGVDCNTETNVGKWMEKITETYIEYSTPIIFSGDECSPRIQSNIESIRLMNNRSITNVLSGVVMFSYFSSPRYNISGKKLIGSELLQLD
jgi:1,3-beta-glucanosyltransferase GAS4